MKRKSYTCIFILCLALFSNCEKEGSGIGKFDDAIVESESNPNKLKQLTFTINLSNKANEYLNLKQIDSIRLKVNGKNWGTFSSESLDTTAKTSRITNGLRYSASKINYLIIAPYTLNTQNLETAGDFTDYLSKRIVLSAGDYVCEVSEIKFRNLNNDWVILKPQLYKDFKVVANTTSSYVGEISVPFN